MESKRVEPRTLPGFMELLPEKQIKFNKIKEVIQRNYEKYGYLPIDTPVIELSEVLLAKAGGETEKQIYSFDKGDKNLSLRFDLTVPFAKYVSMNYGNLSFPFKKYQIGKVYRGERSQRGRFREFYQCDIDVIGDENLSLIYDAELPSIIYSIFKELNFGDFAININNRKIFKGLFEFLGLANVSADALRIIDKIDKIGNENVIEELSKLNIDDAKINKIMEIILLKGTNQDKIDFLVNSNIDNETFKDGLQELTEVLNSIYMYGVPEENIEINLSIVRGLDYYTGTVYETFLNQYRELGSVCSGGRYDNLSSYYTDKKMPGVGISIGLTRLFFQLTDNKIIEAGNRSISKVMIVSMADDFSKSIEIATQLRNNGINTQIYTDNAKIKNQFK